MAGRPWTEAVAAANAAAKQPVLFIHDARLTPRAWALWTAAFEAAGYAALTPPWPSGPDGDAPAKVVAHFAKIAQALVSRPAIIGHLLGGGVAWRLAAAGLSAATVVIASEPLGDERRTQPKTAVEPLGPLLIITGDRDGDAASRRGDQGSAHEAVELPGHGQTLTTSPDWRLVSETALTFIQRFV